MTCLGSSSMKRLGERFAFWILLALLVCAPLIGAVTAAPIVAVAPADSVGSAVDRLLAHPNLKSASIGVEIRSLSDGRVFYARNPHEALIVASNNKLVTTASALFHLGEDYQFETVLFARGPIEDRTLKGDLIVQGGGDPCLADRFFEKGGLEPMEILAAAVVDAGIDGVTGDLVLDDTLFDRQFVAPGWPRDQLSRHYCAPVAGLSFMENVLHVLVSTPGGVGTAARVALEPGCVPFTVTGTIRVGGPKAPNAINLAKPDAQGVIKVRGTTPHSNQPWKGKLAVADPPRYFGVVLASMLDARGVSLAGSVRMAREPVDYGAECRRLGALRTPLRDAVIVTNKESHNNLAEHLFKIAGWKATGQGTFASGSAAVSALLEGLGADRADPFSIVDGSGLSRGNRFSAGTVVALLEGMYNSKLRDLYIRSLPISGNDGSLKERLTEERYRSRVRAKTGWIREVSALSGYVQAQSKEVFAFSIIFNGYKGVNSKMKKVQDDICRVVVDAK